MNLADPTAAVYAPVDTAVGQVFVASTDSGVRFVHPSPADETFEVRYEERFGFRPRPVDRLDREIEHAVSTGDPTGVALDWRGTSMFTRAVLDFTGTIPAGQIVTYGDVADALGRPSAARAVGRALGANPMPFLIPCHRVIAGDGSLGGYEFGVALKQALLEAEGVHLPSSSATG